MATITLSPGESFEHYHLEESVTAHLTGEIEISFNDVKLILNAGQKVVIPPKTSHVAYNIGNQIATFQCDAHVTTEQM